MRIKIEMEMSGNQFLDLIRKVPKSVAFDLYHNTVSLTNNDTFANSVQEMEKFNKSVIELIENKKR